VKEFEVPHKQAKDIEFDLETLKSEDEPKLEHQLANKEAKPTFIHNAVKNNLKGYP